MKAVKKEIEQKEQFKPFQLVLDVETEEEARALYAIFNHTRNTNLLKGEGGEIRRVLSEDYLVIEGEIAQGITYKEFYLNER